jgi:hypothetical protein
MNKTWSKTCPTALLDLRLIISPFSLLTIFHPIVPYLRRTVRDHPKFGLSWQGDELYIRPPFRLRHGKNLLFARSNDNASSPRLVGVIDWDYSHTAPLYFLYEYPTFIQDIIAVLNTSMRKMLSSDSTLFVHSGSSFRPARLVITKFGHVYLQENVQFSTVSWISS